MAVITETQLENAAADASTLEAVVNSPVGIPIVSRLGQSLRPLSEIASLTEALHFNTSSAPAPLDVISNITGISKYSLKEDGTIQNRRWGLEGQNTFGRFFDGNSLSGKKVVFFGNSHVQAANTLFTQFASYAASGKILDGLVVTPTVLDGSGWVVTMGNIYNKGQSGARLANMLLDGSTIESIIALTPDILVIIDPLANDVRQPDISGITNVAQAAALNKQMLDRFTSALPDTTIVLLTENSMLTVDDGYHYVHTWTYADQATAAQAYSDISREAVMCFAGVYQNVVVADQQAAIFGMTAPATSPLMLDQLHPNETGQAATADFIINLLTAMQYRATAASGFQWDPFGGWGPAMNLVPNSEPLLANLSAKSGTVTQASFTEYGLTNGIDFPAAAQLDYAYETCTLTSGLPYTFGVFVVTTDTSVPIVGSESARTFSLIIGGLDVPHALVKVRRLSTGLYYVWATYAAAWSNSYCGIGRYATHNGVGFHITGLQLAALPYRTAYVQTFGSAISQDATQVSWRGMFNNIRVIGQALVGSLSTSGNITTAGQLSITHGATSLNGSIDSGGAFFEATNSKNIRFYAGTAERLVIEQDGTSVHPGADNTQDCGSAAKRWKVVRAGTGTIDTSDERVKKWRGVLTDQEFRAGRRIFSEFGGFQFLDAIAEKGDDKARLHFGARAQRVRDILMGEGLNPEMYAFLCYDEWPFDPGQPEITIGEPGTDEYRIVQRRIAPTKAGSLWGIRYDELLCFILSVLDKRLLKLEELTNL